MTAIRNDLELQRWIAFVRAQNLPLDLSCAPLKNSRTGQQNRLLFGCLYPPISEHTGYEVGGDGAGNGIHEWMCGTYFGWVEKKVPKTPANPSGIESAPFRTTTKDENGRRNVLSTAEFSKFVDHVERMAARAGIYVSREMVA